MVQHKKPRRPSTRTEKVHDALRRAIIEQRLSAGARLPEDAIGESFGTSRTIAREALSRLAAEGLVDLIPNRGAFVANPSLDEGRHIFVVRKALERTVMQQIAGQMTPQIAQSLRALVKDEAALGVANEAEAIRLAGEFHLHLAEMSGNTILQKFVTEVVSRCSLVLAKYARPHSADCAAEEHAQIVEALVAADGSRAGDLMDHHLDSVASRALIVRETPRDVRAVLADYARAI
jgi:DNA-binding GntR family transcriptional regulator